MRGELHKDLSTNVPVSLGTLLYSYHITFLVFQSSYLKNKTKLDYFKKISRREKW